MIFSSIIIYCYYAVSNHIETGCGAFLNVLFYILYHCVAKENDID